MRFRAPDQEEIVDKTATEPRATYQAGTFYTRVFGWDFSPFQGPEDFWPVAQQLIAEWEAAARPGALSEPVASAVTAGVVPGMQAIAVVSLEEASQRILNQGGKVLTPPIHVPGTGYLQYCQDASGHAFGIIEPGDSENADSDNS